MRIPSYIRMIEDDAEANAALQEYLDAIKNGATTYVLIVAKKKSDGTSLTLTEEDISLDGGITITTVLNYNEDLIFGSAVSTECKIEFIKNAKTEDIDFDKSLRINIGININGIIRYATVGVFYGDEPKTVISNVGNDSFEFVGYDYISKTDVSADDFIATLTFPMSLSNLATAFLNFYGVGIRFDSISYSINIENNPFDAGTTIRDILHWIAESQGCYALMYLDDIQVAIRRFQALEYPIYYSIDYTITPNEYFTINKSRIQVSAVPVLKFVSTKYPSKNSQYPTTPVLDGVPYTIVDNPIMANATSISGALNGAYSKTLEYGQDTDNPIYIPMNVSAIGNWLIEAGDIINVEDMDGNTVPMRIFSRVFRWAGSCTDYYECTGNAVRQAMTEDEKTAYQVKQVVGNMTANNLTTTTEGYVLDARQGKVLYDFLLKKTWTPKLYDYETYKRDLPTQTYFQIGNFYVMFIDGSNINYSGISTMIQYRNLPCATCVGGTVYLQGLTSTAVSNRKGTWVQGASSFAYLRNNVVSSDFTNASTGSGRTCVVLFGYS